MPELPEVETTAGDLRPYLLGARITGVHISWPRTLAEPASEALLAARLAGQRIKSVSRRGKYLVVSLESGDTLLVHLRMTGRLRIEPPGSPALDGPHVRAWFDLEDGRHLVFTDQRKFGRIWLLEDPAAQLGRLGPEPLEAAFTAQELAAGLRGRRAAIKAVLLDQRVLAGLGNIYANEALFLAGIHPARPAASLSPAEVVRLHAAIRAVLAEAVTGRGTTLRDYNYRPPAGNMGEYQESLRVHDRAGQPCQTCGTAIEVVRIGQRSSYFCPHCQS